MASRPRFSPADRALKPTRLDISETVRWLGYKPTYSLANLLSELAAFGDGGPPRFMGATQPHAPPAIAPPVGEL